MERKSGEGPIYLKIKEDILQKIEAGEYKKSSRIEPERQLSLQYGVSRMTLRQAIEELVGEGYLYKVQGRGTFVSTPAFQQKNLKSFTDTLRESGHEAKTKVLEVERVHQMRRLCQLLEVPVSMPLVKIKRLRSADEIPTALEMRCARRAVREGRTASPTPSTCVIQPLPRRATCLSASTADAMPRNKQ